MFCYIYRIVLLLWCLNGVPLDQTGAPKCGVSIGWKSVVQEVKEFSRGRTKEKFIEYTTRERWAERRRD